MIGMAWLKPSGVMSDCPNTATAVKLVGWGKRSCARVVASSEDREICCCLSLFYFSHVYRHCCHARAVAMRPQLSHVCYMYVSG